MWSFFSRLNRTRVPFKLLPWGNAIRGCIGLLVVFFFFSLFFIFFWIVGHFCHGEKKEKNRNGSTKRAQRPDQEEQGLSATTIK